MKRTLRLAAIVFVIHGAIAAWMGADPNYVRLILSLGLVCALLLLWLDWRDRRR